MLGRSGVKVVVWRGKNRRCRGGGSKVGEAGSERRIKLWMETLFLVGLPVVGVLEVTVWNL